MYTWQFVLMLVPPGLSHAKDELSQLSLHLPHISVFAFFPQSIISGEVTIWFISISSVIFLKISVGVVAFLTIWVTGISFMSRGGKTPRMSVNRLRGKVQFILSTFDIAALRCLKLCLWSHPTWFEGNTLFSPSPVIRAVTRSSDARMPQETQLRPRFQQLPKYILPCPGTQGSPRRLRGSLHQPNPQMVLVKGQSEERGGTGLTQYLWVALPLEDVTYF